MRESEDLRSEIVGLPTPRWHSGLGLPPVSRRRPRSGPGCSTRSTTCRRTRRTSARRAGRAARRPTPAAVGPPMPAGDHVVPPRRRRRRSPMVLLVVRGRRRACCSRGGFFVQRTLFEPQTRVHAGHGRGGRAAGRGEGHGRRHGHRLLVEGRAPHRRRAERRRRRRAARCCSCGASAAAPSRAPASTSRRAASTTRCISRHTERGGDPGGLRRAGRRLHPADDHAHRLGPAPRLTARSTEEGPEHTCSGPSSWCRRISRSGRRRSPRWP